MRFDLSSQNTKILQEQKKHRQWLIIFLGLSVTVVLGTAAALKLYGQALTHKVRVLDCRVQTQVHEHTDECYVYDEKKAEDVLICGYTDYLIHIHNDDCRDENGRLVCPLEEIEPHTHEEACYEEQQALICGLEGVTDTGNAGGQPVQSPDSQDQSANTPDGGNQPVQNDDQPSEPATEAPTETPTEAPTEAAPTEAPEAPADTEPELVCTVG